MQMQDSAESLGLLLNELYGYTEAKSVIDADAILPLLLIADKYNVKAILLHCTKWLNRHNNEKLRDILLAVSPARGEGRCCTHMREHKT